MRCSTESKIILWDLIEKHTFSGGDAHPKNCQNCLLDECDGVTFSSSMVTILRDDLQPRSFFWSKSEIISIEINYDLDLSIAGSGNRLVRLFLLLFKFENRQPFM